MTLLRDVLRLFSTVATLLVLASFVLFVNDQAGAASRRQLQALGAQGPPSESVAAEGDRERAHGRVREAIEDPNDQLLRPFPGVTSASDVWARRVVSGLAALLVYGVALRLLAGYLFPRRAR